METILITIGIFAVFFFGKFIYDTYLTNNTEIGFQDYKVRHPEEAYRLEKNKGLNFNTNPKINIKDRRESVSLLAEHFGCQPNEVQALFLNDMIQKKIPMREKDEMISVLRNKKMMEARYLNIDPYNTPSGLMEQWAIEYFNNL